MRSILERAAILAGNDGYLKILRENEELGDITTTPDGESGDVELEVSDNGDDTLFDGGDVYQIEVSVDYNSGEFSLEEFTEGLPELIKSAEFIDEDSEKEFSISDVEIIPNEDSDTSFIISIQGSGENIEDFIEVLVNDVLEQDPDETNGDVSVRADLIRDEDGEEGEGDFDFTLGDEDVADGEELEDGSSLVFEAVADVNNSNRFSYGNDFLRVSTDDILGVATTKVIIESSNEVVGSITLDRNRKIAHSSFSKRPLDFYSLDFKSPAGLGRIIIENVLNENTITVDGHDYDYEEDEFRGIRVIKVTDVNGEDVGFLQLNNNTESAFIEYSDGTADDVSYYEFVDKDAEEVAKWVAATHEPAFEEEEEGINDVDVNTVSVDGHDYDYDVDEFRGIRVIKVTDVNGEDVGFVQLDGNAESAFVEYSDGSSDGISYYEFVDKDVEEVARWIASTYEPNYEEEEEESGRRRPFEPEGGEPEFDIFGSSEAGNSNESDHHYEYEGDKYRISVFKYADGPEIITASIYVNDDEEKDFAKLKVDHARKSLIFVDLLDDSEGDHSPSYDEVIGGERHGAKDLEDIGIWATNLVKSKHIG